MSKVVIGIILFWAISSAEPPSTLWIRTYGGSFDDEAWSVDETTDAGFIVAGYTESFGVGGKDVYLVRVDSNGDTLWTKTFGGPQDDQAYSVQQTSDGGFIVAGWTGANFAEDFYLVKTDQNGNLVWSTTYGGSQREWCFEAEETSDGGYVLVGMTRSFGPGVSGVYLVKTDQNGNLIWSRTYGGWYADMGYSVKETNDGGYIISGETGSFGDINGDVYLIKTDANGDTLWTKVYGWGDWDFGRSVQQTSDGGYIVCGELRVSSVDGDVWLLKTDQNGDTLWTKRYGTTLYEEGHSVQQTSDGGYILTGYTSSYGAGYWDVWLIKTDESGDTSWTQTFGTSNAEWGNSVKETSDGGYIVAGSARYYGPSGWNWDFYLIRLGGPVLVREKDLALPKELHLVGTPNPLRGKITLTYNLPWDSKVKLNLYDIRGRLVQTLFEGLRKRGIHQLKWSPDAQIPPGSYILMMEGEGYRFTYTLLLLR